MAEHLTIEQLDAYGQQRLSFAELIATDAHLAECAACRQRLEAALPGSTMALYADLQVEAASPAHLSFEQMAFEHLSFEQMANYVEREGDDPLEARRRRPRGRGVGRHPGGAHEGGLQLTQS